MLKDASDIIDDPEHNNAVMENIQGLFKTNNKDNKIEWRVFGMEPKTFENSTENPRK